MVQTDAERKVSNQAAVRKYTKSKKGKKTKKKYNTSPAGRRRRDKYEKTTKGKKVRKKIQIKSDAKPKRKTRKKVTDKKRRDTHEYKKKVHDERIELRMQVLSYYSKLHSKSDVPCCRCCREDGDLEFLSVDHILGKKKMAKIPELIKLKYKGNKEGVHLLKWIIKNDYLPQYFQTLYHNCNQSKGHSKDNKCAHERE